jgi:Animal haem peroxidase/Catalase
VNTTWREHYEGGAAEAERLLFDKLAVDIMQVQLKTKQRAKTASVARAFHAKPVYNSTHAEFCFVDDLPPSLCRDFAQPGKCYPAIVRLSNADGASQSDHKRDLRGIAVRVTVDQGTTHDLLATSYPVSHARNARQFVAFAKATAGGPIARLLGLIGLGFKFGPSETARMVNNVLHARRETASLALETYWSRGAIRWGEAAVRYQFRPAPGAAHASAARANDPDFLSSEFASRLEKGDVLFDVLVQSFVDETRTPIEDTAVEWTEQASPPLKVASLIIRKSAATASQTFLDGRIVEELAFNPWNTTDAFRPLGNLNRARKAAYDASSAHRLRYRFLTVEPLRNRIRQMTIPLIFSAINRFVPWHKLPLQMSLLNLDAFRFVLRRENLIDTEIREAPPRARSLPPPVPEELRDSRDDDGRYNDVSAPEMGAAGAAFGRNMAPILRPDLFDTPDLITVSRQLLQRKSFIPASSLNILAAAWIQFQVHDWVNHDRRKLGEDDIVVPLPKGMTWQSSVDGDQEAAMRIAGNTGFVSPSADRPPIYFKNTETHWWDASQLYGDVLTKTKKLRDGAKIRLENGYLPPDVSGFEATGFNQNWWLGLSAMHTLFAREHNVVCDELRRAYRNWSDERIFQTARLIVAALIAKIHTIEWTPAILGTRALQVGMRTNWSGPPNNPLFKAGLWLVDEHGLKGIPQTTPDHDGTPYSLTEDFVTVYRMHPLIPDDYCFYDSATGKKLSNLTFFDIQGDNTDRVMREKGLRDVLYSFGTAYPGAITLHNFPNSLMKFNREGEIVDLSVVDLARTRRRGVPRYNDFRVGLHKPRITRWEDLAADPEDARLLREIYKDIDLVDTMVGLYAETPPAGFGFSDTAFRIFILMASRRLQSDRFLNVDFRSEIYSPLGMDWVANNGMKSIIQRHCPELASLFASSGSAFAPWRPIISGS